jgi:general secretion pathway protein G
MRRNYRAFSLLELLLVLVILAVLAGLILPKFVGRSEQAKVTAAKADIANLEVALDAFEIDNGRYPTADEGLSALVEKPAGLEETWKGPYIKRGIPKDPWQTEYTYEYPGRHNENGYDLHSMGPDLQDGSQDDLNNWADETNTTTRTR